MNTSLVPLTTHKDIISGLEDLLHLGQVLVKSGMLPASIRTPEAAVAVILKGREIGMPVMESFALINVIQGKPTIAPQGMLALINRSKELEDISISDDGIVCSVSMKRRGRSAVTSTFSMADAEMMGLSAKDNWKKQPKTMRQWRAVAACARVVFPDVIGGMYLPEEMGAEVNDEGEIISHSEAYKIAESVLSGSDVTNQSHVPVESEVSQVSADNMIVIAGKAFPKDKPIGAKAVNGTEAEWFKLHIIGNKYFADKNRKFVRSHYDNHLKAHFGLSSASNLTGEMLKALYDHINGIADDPRWYPDKKKAEPTFEERVGMAGLEALYQEWRGKHVTTPEDQTKLDGIFSNLFEFVEKYPVDIKTPEGIAELNKHIEDAWR